MKATCGGCPATWTGQNICHCSNCHHTFSSIRWFDAHRHQRGERGGCLDPAALKHRSGIRKGERLMKLNEHGVWVGAGDRPAHWKEAA